METQAYKKFKIWYFGQTAKLECREIQNWPQKPREIKVPLNFYAVKISCFKVVFFAEKIDTDLLT